MCATKWALLSLCLLLPPVSYAAGESGAKGRRGAGDRDERGSNTCGPHPGGTAEGAGAPGRDEPFGCGEGGEVTLSGSVGNTAQAERAVKVARGVEGVQRVEDKLVRESRAVSCDPPSIHRHRWPRRTVKAKLTSHAGSSCVIGCLLACGSPRISRATSRSTLPPIGTQRPR